jgi:hypothetical protein
VEELVPIPFQILARIRDLTDECHHEAAECAKARLYRPACVMLGAALEGRLLHTVILVKISQGDWQSLREDDPLRWGLHELVKFAIVEGWIEAEYRGQRLLLDEGDLGNAVDWLKWLRNLIHPGRFVRSIGEGTEGEFTFVGYEVAYVVLEEVFERLTEVVDDSVRAMFDRAE